jgi:hypothetical protein
MDGWKLVLLLDVGGGHLCLGFLWIEIPLLVAMPCGFCILFMPLPCCNIDKGSGYCDPGPLPSAGPFAGADSGSSGVVSLAVWTGTRGGSPGVRAIGIRLQFLYRPERARVQHPVYAPDV